MARGINKVILVGNLGNDPEVKSMPSGGMVANVSIATSSSWKDKNTGEMKENTEWHRVVFFNRLAEIVGEYLRKGSQIYVEGRLQTRKWQDQSGADRYSTEVVGSEMQMLGGRGGSGGGMDGGNGGGNRAPATNYNQAAPQTKQAAPSGPAPDFDSFDDDIPF